ncbi:MAG: 50S ribosomal protein L25/general stress protein Ctc [Gemmatimonadota bacterium]
MATVQFTAESRSDTGKGVARKLRAAGRIPGVIYGHARAPQPLSLNTRDFVHLLEKFSYATTVFELDLAGTTSNALIREIQRHPYRKEILHVDFQELVAGEKVTVRVPIVYVGASIGVKEGGIIDQIMHELEIHVDPMQIPNHLDVDITNLGIGRSLHVSDLQMPEGVEVLDDENATVCTCAAPKAAEETVVTPAEGAVVAEPEVLTKGKKEEEGAEAGKA